MKEENQNGNSLEGLLKRLYNPKKETRKRLRRKIHEKRNDVEKKWAGDNKEIEKPKYLRSDKYKKKVSPFKKIFFGASLFFIIVILITIFSLIQRREIISADSISIEISGKTFVDGGKESPIFVKVQNFNPVPLELVELILQYQKGADSNIRNNVIINRTIGQIPIKDSVSEKFQVVLFGKEGEEKDILASLYYRLPGSNAVFQKDETFSVIIRSAPILLSIDAPESSVQNQQIPIKFNIISNSSSLIENVLFNIDYPIGFEFLQADPEPSFGDNIWLIGDMQPEDDREIKIYGTMYGFENQAQSFNARLGIQDEKDIRSFLTIFNSLVHTVSIGQSFLDAQIILNGSSEKNITAKSQTDIDGTILWENTLDTQIQDAIIKLNISGNAYDSRKVNLINGFFNSQDGTITWDQNTNDNLEFLQPDEKGRVSFSVASSSLVNNIGQILKDPEINFSIDVEGLESGGLKRIDLSIDSASISIHSDFHLLANTLYYSGLFQNSGPMPPRVGSETTYTVILQVTNTSNMITDVVVKTSLPSYVNWKDNVAPTIEANNLNYNKVTRKIEWKLGTVKSAVGVNNTKPREVSFQVSVIPSFSQVGNNLDLTTEIELSGKDSWTDTVLKESKKEINNRLLNDTSDIGVDGKVVE